MCDELYFLPTIHAICSVMIVQMHTEETNNWRWSKQYYQSTDRLSNLDFPYATLLHLGLLVQQSNCRTLCYSASSNYIIFIQILLSQHLIVFIFFWCTFFFSLFLSSKYWIQNRCGLLKVEAPQDPPEKTGGPTGASQNEPETPQNVPEMPQNPPEVPSSPVDVSKMDEMIAAANLCGDSKVPISDLWNKM